MVPKASLADFTRGPAVRLGMKVRSAVAGVGAVAVGVAAALLSILTLQRYQLPYNSEGRYFDAASSVVYKQQAVEVFFLIALFGWLLTAALAYLCWLFVHKRPSRSRE